MSFRFTEPKFTIVRKAKGRKPVTSSYKRLENLSHQMGMAVQLNLVKGLKKFKTRVSDKKVYEAWKTGNYQNVVDAVPWDKMPEDIHPAFSRIGSGLFSASREIVIPSLPAPVQSELRYDTKNPRITSFIESRVARNVTEISDSAQESIKAAVTRSLDRAMTPRQVAEDIKGSIGLYPRLSGAVDNYRMSLQKNGLEPGKVDKLTGAYYDRLLDYRAMTIARSETRMAINTGQLEVWKQSSEQGLIGSASRKIWILDGNPCEECIQMASEEPVELYEQWELSDGTLIDVPNEIHPNCMCGMELEIVSENSEENPVDESETQDDEEDSENMDSE